MSAASPVVSVGRDRAVADHVEIVWAGGGAGRRSAGPGCTSRVVRVEALFRCKRDVEASAIGPNASRVRGISR